jgi:hypothetical protein
MSEIKNIWTENTSPIVDEVPKEKVVETKDPAKFALVQATNNDVFVLKNSMEEQFPGYTEEEYELLQTPGAEWLLANGTSIAQTLAIVKITGLGQVSNDYPKHFNNGESN